MGCSGRKSYQDIKPEQKWDFISLNDFKSTSCFAPLAYGYLWGSLLVSVAVYGVDTFTAVNLLAFDNWVGAIKPKVPTEIARLIFSICIILSWLNLAYEYWRAIRVMKRGAVAESYLDSLAVRIQCIRMGDQGRGWRRFLVFAELTKSKKGVEYVALFVYFSFQAWIRVIFCSGPRQVVNALTLWAVFQASLDPKKPDAGSSIIGFFKNIGYLASTEHQQAVILCGMLFTLVIWVFAAVSLLIAVVLYLLFLWHYIPNSDGGLSGYCERKINGRLTRIVSAKVNKALEDEERKKFKDAKKAAKNGMPVPLGRQATLPTLFDAKSDDKLPGMPMLSRNDTITTLPLYTSRPGTPSSQQPQLPGFELNTLDQKKSFPMRPDTSSSALSTTSFASNAPLMGAAGEMGYGPTASSASTLPSVETDSFPFPQRSMTGDSNGRQWQRGPQPIRNGSNGRPPSRQMTSDSYSSDRRGPPSRQMSQDQYQAEPGPPLSRQRTMDDYTASPVGYDDSGRDGARPQHSYGRPPPRPFEQQNGRSTPGAASVGRRTPFSEVDRGGRSSPGPSSGAGSGRQFAPDRESSGSGPGVRSPSNANSQGVSDGRGSGGYPPLNPTMRSASAGIPGPAPTFQPPPQQRLYRNMTEPMQAPSRKPTGEYFSPPPPQPRQGTPQNQRGVYNDPYSNNGYRDGSGGDPRAGAPVSYNGRPGPPPQRQGGYRR